MTTSIYFSFFELRHNGFAICILSEEEAIDLSNDEYNYDKIPCKITINSDDKFLYIPNIKEEGFCSSEINEIKHDPSSYIISINVNEIEIGQNFYEDSSS